MSFPQTPPIVPPPVKPPASPDDDTLVLPIDQHVAVHLVRQGVYMWGVFVLGLGEGETHT